MQPDIINFIKTANKQTTGKGTTDEATKYIRENRGTKNSLKIEISFGVGRASAIPWIAFTGYNQTVTNGIYPVYLYYKDLKILILAYGVSETATPSKGWATTTQTISDYFEKHNIRRPERYGSSLVHRVYDATNLPNEDTLESDLDNIIQEYKILNGDKSANIIKQKKHRAFSIMQFQSSISDANLTFNILLITRFVASLLTKPFVILTGLSGSGKTKLAQSFAQWICQDKNQYRIIPVGADWTNREPLLGYPNALNGNEYIKPDNDALGLILRAIKNPTLPYFLILDEMNLSHVERYFADFLSAMESHEEISLYAEGIEKSGTPAKLRLPTNLFIIGTVNIDETTNMFSPKVLDRANTIEFRVTNEDMKIFLEEINGDGVKMTSLVAKGAPMAKNFLELSEKKYNTVGDAEIVKEKLLLFFGELKKTGAEFGYRSVTEMLRLINQLSVLNPSLSISDKIDIAIIQKLLPKLHGSRRKLVPVLEQLAGFCLNGNTELVMEALTKDNFDFNRALFPLSLEKIARMHKGAIDNGFASFAEA